MPDAPAGGARLSEFPSLAPLEPGAVLAAGTVLYVATPGLDPASVRLAVTIPTFKRPAQVVETMTSIATQLERHRGAFVIVENDAEGREGAQAASAFLEREGRPGLVLVALQAGNCNAYNSGWRAVLDLLPNAAAIAVADDDETAHPGWLDALVAQRAATQSDVIGGPQMPVFTGQAPKAVHPVFHPAYTSSGVVPMLYSSGNLLVARRVLEAMPFPFLDPMFNFTGGGDADFFRRAKAKGFRFAWAADAVLHETVPPRRLEADWLRARSLRNGALSAIIDRRANPGAAGRIKVLAKSLALLGASPFRAALELARGGTRADARYRMDIGLGRMMGELGWINEQYRAPEKN
jgi:hypothetical protein